MKRWQADLSLALVALIWGSTFVMVKNAVETVDPLTFIAWRFTLASLFLILLFSRRLWGLQPREVVVGGLIGIWLTLGYMFQTIGLQDTTSAKAGFITGLSVVIVPVVATVLLRRPPGRGSVAGILAAAVGLGLLTLNDDLHIQSGDLWVLGCAVAFAFHIVAVARFSPIYDPVRLAIVQIMATAVLTFGAAAIFETPRADLPAETWASIAFTGLVATALAFGLQVYMQRFTTPTHTALLFSLEPVFAAFFGWWWAGDVLGLRELLGCGLILAGMLFAELGDQPAAPQSETPGLSAIRTPET